MSKPKDIRTQIANNSMKTCAVKGCTRSRHSLARYCSSHQHQYYQYGHPLASQIKPKDMETEKELAAKVIALNEEHKGIEYGIQFLNKLLLECAQGTSFVPHGDYLANLQAQGVTGKDILTTLSALYILRDGVQGRIKSDKHLTFLLGHFVLRIAKQASRAYGTHRKAIGQYLQDSVGVLCLNISKAAQEMSLKRNETLLNMGKPLSLI